MAVTAPWTYPERLPRLEMTENGAERDADGQHPPGDPDKFALARRKLHRPPMGHLERARVKPEVLNLRLPTGRWDV